MVAIVCCTAGAVPLSLRRPEAATALFATTAIFTWSWPHWLQTAANVVYWGAALAIGIAFARLAWRQPSARRWAVVAAVAAAAPSLTALWSVDPRTSLAETVKLGVVLGVAAFAAALVTSSRARADSLARGVALVAPLVLVATAIVVALGLWDEELASDGTKSGIFDGPNILGAVLALTMPFLLAHPSVWRSWPVSLALVAIVAYVVLASGSRTGFVAVAVAVGVLQLGRRRWWRLAAELGAMVAVLISVAAGWAPQLPALGQPLQEGASAQNEVLLGTNRPAGQSRFSALVGARDEGWREAIRIVGFRPIAGHGFGTGAELFERYDSASRFRYFVGAFTATTTHNGFLQALVELGIVGSLPLFVAALGAAAIAVGAVVRRWRSASAAAFGGALAAALSVALFESTFWQAGPLTVLTWLAFAGVAATWLRERSGAAGKGLAAD